MRSSLSQTGTGGIRKKAKHLARKTAEDWTARDVGTYASSIAFFFFMSMIPLLIIIFQLLPIFGLSQVDLIKFLDRMIPEAMQGSVAGLQVFQGNIIFVRHNACMVRVEGNNGAAAGT